ncbi:MAG: 3-methylornithyl-N6-L-lysine dehydrogenase PylD [Deltaproteobacteria bacterium]|nr:MAG: 3-methylornithyl-N6-L-lysine dehydrogenase PylD [Deltaproteobacteria bacterium]
MTRLKTEDVKSIPADLTDYDSELIAKTGCTLSGIACRAAKIPEADIQKSLETVFIGVIPVTSGEGVISGFCEAVASIISHLGCQTFITQATDVAGIAEAFEKKAAIVLLSDDDCFIALHVKSRQIINNAVATGKGFVVGLNLMAGDLRKRNVLVIGCGPVGKSATEELAGMGALVSIYDTNFSRSAALSEAMQQSFNAKVNIVDALDLALTTHQFMIDATPAADIISARHITPHTYISAPGVPLGLDEKARLKIGNRLLHDPLQIGVATMVVCACKLHLQNVSNS